MAKVQLSDDERSTSELPGRQRAIGKGEHIADRVPACPQR
jgi:hypothetical protein